MSTSWLREWGGNAARPGFALLLGMCTMWSCATNDASNAPQPTEDWKLASALYATHCSGCHGEAGEGVVGPPLTGTDLIQKFSLEAQAALINNGTPRGMPPFNSRLSQTEISLLTQFTRSF